VRGAIHPERKVMYMAMKAYARAVAVEMIAACRDDNELPVQVQTVLRAAEQEVMLFTGKWLSLQDDRHQYLTLAMWNETAPIEGPKKEDLEGVLLKNGKVQEWKKLRQDKPLLLRTNWEVRVDGVLHPITVLFDAECAATVMTRKAACRIGAMPRCS